MDGVEKFQDELNISAGKRYCINTCGCCGNKKDIEHKYFNGKWPKYERAPDPSLIIWGNLGVTPVRQCCRSFGVLIISTIIVIASFAAIVWGI